MNLADYLRKLTPEGRALVAQRCETSVGYLYLLAGGHRRASVKKAKLIVAASENEVPLSELRPDIYAADPATQEAAA